MRGDDFISGISGRIFDIQRFSVHDGPGIRTVVFFKGCALRCRWCCNPESQRFDVEKMCMGGKTKTVGEDVSIDYIAERVMRDLPYYRRSGGGVTLSGGEFLLQPDFAAALLANLKEFGLNTAVESSGFADFDVISRILPHIDLFMLDIKHTNTEKHRIFTTKGNALILENAQKIAENAKQLIIRVPVIPTFNDTIDEISGIAEFAKSLPNVTELHLLPYHRLGSDKYTGLSRNYEMANALPPADEHMQKLADAVRKTGLICRIGG